MDKKEYLVDIYETGTEYIDDWGDQYEADEFERWFNDAVPAITGADNQSFYCNSIRAREAVGDAMFDDEIRELVGDFDHCDGWEQVDVAIRCALVYDVKDKLKEYWEESFPDFDDLLVDITYWIRNDKQPTINELKAWREKVERLQGRYE